MLDKDLDDNDKTATTSDLTILAGNLSDSDAKCDNNFAVENRP